MLGFVSYAQSLMNMTGACRNCLAKWLAIEGWKGPDHSPYKSLDYDGAKALVYGAVKVAKPAATKQEMARSLAVPQTICHSALNWLRNSSFSCRPSSRAALAMQSMLVSRKATRALGASKLKTVNAAQFLMSAALILAAAQRRTELLQHRLREAMSQ